MAQSLEGVDDTKESKENHDSTSNAVYKFICDLKYDNSNIAESGLFYYLGTKGKTEKYTNPYQRCIIDARSSRLKGTCQISSYIGLKHEVSYCITEQNKDSHFEIDLKDKYLIPTDYVLRNYSNGDRWWITGWNLEGKGSAYNDEWEVINSQKRNNDLKGKGKICVFECDKNKFYKCFRIRMTDTMNDQSSWELGLSGFELYGYLYKAYSIPNKFELICDLKYDELNKVESGLFYYLGTNCKTEKYISPYQRCIIDARSSRLKGTCQISSYIGLKHEVSYCITEQNKDSHFEIDLKDKYLIPTDYVLRNYSNGDRWWITGWNLEGSNNGKRWDIVDSQKRNNDLKGKGKICHFEIKTKSKCYKQFRIKMTNSMNNQSSWQLGLSGFELYGYFLK